MCHVEKEPIYVHHTVRRADRKSSPERPIWAWPASRKKRSAMSVLLLSRANVEPSFVKLGYNFGGEAMRR